MDEATARTKWCPMVRYLAVFKNSENKRESVESYNRGAEDTGLENAACIASECMMWRWYDDSFYSKEVSRDYTTGYCGLAGKEK